jgi:hypothetical protein
MATYSRYNSETGKFDYFQGVPVQFSGDPTQWDYSMWGHADPAAYASYWSTPDGMALARAMQYVSRAASPASSADVQETYAPFSGQMLPPELRYQPVEAGALLPVQQAAQAVRDTAAYQRQQQALQDIWRDGVRSNPGFIESDLPGSGWRAGIF